MNVLKKFLKAICLLIASSLIIYLVFTISAFIGWCNENQISIVDHSDDMLEYLDPDKIQGIGNLVGTMEQVMKDSLQDNSYHSLAEDYDPLGFSVWSYMNMGIQDVLTKYLTISILLGFSIAIAYVVITSKKLNAILKIAIGYLGVMLLIPYVYMYSYTYRFWSISETFHATPKYFFLLYTVIFLVMYLINYLIGKNMAKNLNQTIKNT
jgi:hypothetical protein